MSSRQHSSQQLTDRHRRRRWKRSFNVGGRRILRRTMTTILVLMVFQSNVSFVSISVAAATTAASSTDVRNSDKNDPPTKPTIMSWFLSKRPWQRQKKTTTTNNSATTRSTPTTTNAAVGGRSSTASHFSKNHETITAGVASDTFWGIDLSSSSSSLLSTQSLVWQYIILLLVGIGLPYIVAWYCHGELVGLPPQKQQKMVSTLTLLTIVILFGLGSIFWIIPYITTIPLRTIIYTRTSYPYPVVIIHCLAACTSYRKNHEPTTTTTTTTASRSNDEPSSSESSSPPRCSSSFSYLHSLLGTFFLYGFGGSIVSDLLMGLPVTALSHPRIVPCFVLCWILVWFSPFDVVYRYVCGGGNVDNVNIKDNNYNYYNKTSLLYFIFVAGEAIDAVTTPMGRVSRSARELQNKVTAPILAGLLAGIGGATLRFVSSEPSTPKTFQSALETGFWKTLWYSILWWSLAVLPCLPATTLSEYTKIDLGRFDWLWSINDDDEEKRISNHCNAYNGNDTIRVLIVSCHVLWTLCSDVGIVHGHPLVWFSKNVILKAASVVSLKLRLGRSEQTQYEEKSSSYASEGIQDKKNK